jgi:hypothetical protein
VSAVGSWFFISVTSNCRKSLALTVAEFASAAEPPAVDPESVGCAAVIGEDVTGLANNCILSFLRTAAPHTRILM